MGKVPNSYVTIDSDMLLKTEDEALRKFIGQGNKDMFASFASYIHPEDKDIFRDAFEALKAKSMAKNVVMARLIDSDENYCWAVITFSPNAQASGDEAIFTLHIEDPDDDFIQQIEDSRNEYGAFLDLMNGILFSYETDTKQLSIFVRNGGQKLTLFSDSLDKWREDMLGGKLDMEFESAFSGLCRDLEMKRSNFSCRLRTSSFSKDNKMEECIFKAQLVEERDGEKIVGVITPLNIESVEQTTMGYVRDIALPVLNKKSITDYARRAMTVGDNKVCLVILDLDNFKTVNDTLGHMVGDEVLLRSAEIIKAALGDLGILGRIGGDEMMIVFPRVESETELRNTLRTIRTNIEWEYKDKWEDVKVTCSMGAAVYPDNGNSYDDIFSLADKMLYIAKSKGKNRYVIFVPEIHGAILNPDQKTTGDILQQVQGDRSGVMQRLVEQFLVRRVMTLEQMLTSVGTCFNLDEIVMVSGERYASSNANIWSPKGYSYEVQDSVYSSPEKSFLDSFDDDNTLVIHAISKLEGISVPLYNKLKAGGVESVLFYKFSKSCQYSGYLVFAKATRRQMWSEEDKVLLALVGKIAEMSFQ